MTKETDEIKPAEDVENIELPEDEQKKKDEEERLKNRTCCQKFDECIVVCCKYTYNCMAACFLGTLKCLELFCMPIKERIVRCCDACDKRKNPYKNPAYHQI